MATIQGIYLAFFGRPADPLGLEYWEEQTNDGADLSVMLNALSGTEEYQDRFVGMSNEEVVQSIYQALFGRDAEPDGLAHFLEALENGTQTLGSIAVNVLDGAQGSDLAMIENKIAAADLFTASLDTPEEIAAYSGNEAAEFGRQFLSTVTEDPETVPTADAVQEQIDTDLPDYTPDEGQAPGGGGGGGTGGGASYDVVAGEKIQEAVDAAEVGATIRVGPGTFSEDVLISKDVTIVFHNTTVLKGGFAVAGGVDAFNLEGGTIDGGLANAVSGVASSVETNLGIYAQGATAINVKGVDFVDTDGSGDMRGVAGNAGQDAKFTVSNSTFTDLLTGIYLNPGNDAAISGSTFTDNTAGVGGVGTGTELSIEASKFSGNHEDVGVDPDSVIGSLKLSGNAGLENIAVWNAGGPFWFNPAGDVDELGVILVGLEDSVSDIIADSGAGNVILLGKGQHQENLNVDKQIVLKGVDGAVLVSDGSPQTVTLLDGADGSLFEGLTILAGANGSAVVNNSGQDVRDVVFINNIFDAGGNLAGPLVYLNPGADGWVFDGNTFQGQYLNASPLLGIEGNGHLVVGNTFGAVAGGYEKIEIFTPNVVIKDNTGITSHIFKDDTTDTDYVLNLIEVPIADLTASLVGEGYIEIGDPISSVDGRESSIAIGGGSNDDSAVAKVELIDQIRLGDIDVLQFDYFVEHAQNSYVTPTFSLLVDKDGDLETTEDQYQLVFEWAGGPNGYGQAPNDAWVTRDLDEAVAWQLANGKAYIGSNLIGYGNPGSAFQFFSTWQDGVDQNAFEGGVTSGETDTVYGFSIRYGNTNGELDAFADNVVIGSIESESVSLYSFV